MTDTTWLDEAIIDSAKRVGLWTDEMSDDIRKGERTRLYIDIPSLKATILTKLEEARADELKTLARKYWQKSVPEQAILDRIAELNKEVA